MKNISELAREFKQHSENELKNINERAQQATKQLENDLKQLLKNVQSEINQDIQALRTETKNETDSVLQDIKSELTRLKKQAINRGKKTAFLLTALNLILLITMIVLGMKSNTAYNESKMWEQSAEQWKMMSKGIYLTQCLVNNKKQPCVAIEQNHIGETWQNEQGKKLKILEIQPTKQTNKEK